MEDRLAEIKRKRDARNRLGPPIEAPAPMFITPLSEEDEDWLIAELEKARAIIDTLKYDIARLSGDPDQPRGDHGYCEWDGWD